MPVIPLEKFVQSVKMTRVNNRTMLAAQPADWHFVGQGRSAFVFKMTGENKVVKVFFPEFAHLAKEEADIYHCLEGLPYFPKLYNHGPNYVVMDFIEGKTLYQCLVEGIVVTEKMIEQVDAALDSARKRGLNPSDIHLRNIILTPGGDIKMIDVVRFRQRKDCIQWEDLKRAYYSYYRRRFFPKRMSPVILDFIAKGYKKDMLPFV